MLNTEDATVSRVDPRSGAVIRTFEPRRRPADVAAGAGALWIGSRPGPPDVAVAGRSRDREVTRTVRLPGGADGLATEGFPTDRRRRRRRLDDQPGRDGVAHRRRERAARHHDQSPPAGASTIAAGGRGRVGARLGEHAVADRPTHESVRGPDRARQQPPARDRRRRRIGVGDVRGGRCCGASSPDRDRSSARSSVGAGVQYVAFGDGARLDGELERRHALARRPATNAVTARVPVGAAQALAAGAGSAWVSVAGGSRNGVLPASACGEVVAGGGTPDVLVATDMPLRERTVTGPRAIADAVRFVIRDHGFRAGRYAVGYHSCDDSTAQTGGIEFRKCAANANAFATRGAARRGDRPLLLVLRAVRDPDPQPRSGWAARAPRPHDDPSEPHARRAAGAAAAVRVSRRTGRVLPDRRAQLLPRWPARGDLAGVAIARLAKSLGLRSVYLLDDAPTLRPRAVHRWVRAGGPGAGRRRRGPCEDRRRGRSLAAPRPAESRAPARTAWCSAGRWTSAAARC